jgi:glyoxylase-like metal-dependent hydrolase (beta-lactamase superfamily II)
MPLDMSLKFINVYALRDGPGWTVIDTGMQTKATAASWRAAFEGPLEGLPVHRIIVTHMHPDHCGMAGWLARKFDGRLWMSRLEYISCRMLAADTGREAPEDGVRFYQRAGWNEDALENYRARFGGFGKGVYPMPDSYRRLTDGDRVEIGGREWRVATGAGHSPEHVCLYSPELNLFVSGDQVLPRISSNVSLFPTEPEADPMKDWLTSLARMKKAAPADALVLPSHNDPFHGLHVRIDHLIRGHERAMTRLAKMLAEEKRAIDVFPALFARPIGPDVLGMATGESLAHLNCLLHRGVITKRTDESGVDWYKAL